MVPLTHSSSFRHFFIWMWLSASLLACNDKKQNHLKNATSQYLKAHIDNPVDWFEWSPAAFQQAESEGKPLLISIGYSACHWCHVMERESFMDTAVARVMNENFVCIKVDREERPDVDNMYSYASQIISGSSGWPLNCFALPDGKPFFTVTYSTKKSWINLLRNISSTYKTQRNKVKLQAKMIASGISDTAFLAGSTTNLETTDQIGYKEMFENVYSKMDTVWGGLRGAPKFPASANLEFLLQYYYFTKDKRALVAATNTLNKMALGGIYDQAGGGFARYATDSVWHIPHFEKMLYDNAQLITTYSHAYQLTGNKFYEQVVFETIQFIERELKSNYGGYYSSLNADSKDGEGEYYAWTTTELQQYLKKDYGLLSSYYNATKDGNWKTNKNILYASELPAQFAEKLMIDSNDFFNVLTVAKKTLLTERNKKEKPLIDNKIILSWNAILLKGYIDAYTAFGNNSYLTKSVSLAIFLERKMQMDGKLGRTFTDGKLQGNGFLEDYTFLAQAYIRLYQASFDKHWLDLSRKIVDRAIELFYDGKSKLFFYTAHDPGSPVIRRLEITDNDLPSSNAVMADVLTLLGTYYENGNYLDKANSMIRKITNRLSELSAGSAASWKMLKGLLVYSRNKIVITGKDAVAKNLEIQTSYLPNAVFAGSSGEENLPLLAGKNNGEQTVIYVCRNRVCKKPVTEVASALEQLTR